MRWISVCALGFCAARGLLAAPPVPRPAQEITIETPEGKLSVPRAFRGKVVVMQFLYTTCTHCQATARMLSGLERDLGPRGFQVVGVAFNEEAQNSPEAIHRFVAANQVNFPVGAASREAVMKYLGISVVERFVVPQIMIVDRKGVIRAQSDFMGTSELQDEAWLRRFISGLLEKPTIPRNP
jgi:peroxiredoxin